MGLWKKFFSKTDLKEKVHVKIESIPDNEVKSGIDYDTHLKPATVIKKEHGEDKAIKYLISLYESGIWSVEDRFAILSKCKGYYKKANEENKEWIISGFQNLLREQKHFRGAHDLSKIYVSEKKYEEAFQMISLAALAISPNDDTYFHLVAENSSVAANILSDRNLDNSKVALDFLYYHLHYLLFKISSIIYNDKKWNSNQEEARENLKDIDPNFVPKFQDNFSEFRVSLSDDFPFDDKLLLKALLVVNPESNIEQNREKIYSLLFDRFPNELDNIKSFTQTVPIADNIINSYLEEL